MGGAASKKKAPPDAKKPRNPKRVRRPSASKLAPSSFRDLTPATAGDLMETIASDPAERLAFRKFLDDERGAARARRAGPAAPPRAFFGGCQLAS